MFPILAILASMSAMPTTAPSVPVPTDIREGTLAVEGGKVWFRIVGAEKKATPLLVLHGGPGVPHDYLEPLEALGDERPVVFYDQLGCGNSDRPDRAELWTLSRFVGELRKVREELKLERVHLLGQSWGAALAVEYLLTQNPKGVASLTLSGPLISARRWADDQRKLLAGMPQGIRKAVADAEKIGKFDGKEYQDAIGAYYHKHVCRLDPWPEPFNRALEKMGTPVYLTMWGPSEFTVTGNLKEFDRVADLGKLKLPILLTAGEHDEVLPETVEIYRKALPGAKVRVFEGASHVHHLERPDEYLKLLRDFLGGAEAATSR